MKLLPEEGVWEKMVEAVQRRAGPLGEVRRGKGGEEQRAR